MDDDIAVLRAQVKEQALRLEMVEAGQKLLLEELARSMLGRESTVQPEVVTAETVPTWGTNAEDLEALTPWVDGLIASYDLTATKAIRPCWQSHPGVVKEFAALHAEWGQIGKTISAVAWHEHMAGVLWRLETLYQISRCKPERHEPARRNPSTDTDDR